MVRCFIAIDFNEEVMNEIERVEDLLSGIKFTGKLTEPENIHLTLKFLGEIDDDKVEEVKKRLQKVKFDGFEVGLGRTGVFHVRGNPKIVWLKLEGKELWDLQKKIDDTLEGLFVREERFMAHITVGRIKYVKDKKGFEEYVENLGIKKLKFKVKSFELKKSELFAIGPVYSTIEKYNLFG